MGFPFLLSAIAYYAGYYYELHPLLCGLISAAIWTQLTASFNPNKAQPILRNEDFGYTDLKASGTGVDRYLDLMKRALMNILYYETSLVYWFYADGKVSMPKNGFSLERRMQGEDSCGNALTMIGNKRLDNIRETVETIIKENIPGDLLETGVYKGGGSIYIKAVMEANGEQERKLYCADCFVDFGNQKPGLVQQILQPIFGFLASIPSIAWKRWFFNKLQRLPNPNRNFPIMENPSDETVEYIMQLIRSGATASASSAGIGTSVEHVESHFARFGLMDDRVVFLKGFFADTLPDAPYECLSMLRLDGDTYESTVDALYGAYDKLSEGGFCIVDDYFAFKECQQAVDEYRTKHGISDEIIRIDGMGVYWRKGSHEPVESKTVDE